MAKSKFKATSTIDNIDNKVVKPGDIVKLEPDAAAPFVSGGSLVPVEDAAPSPEDPPAK